MVESLPDNRLHLRPLGISTSVFLNRPNVDLFPHKSPPVLHGTDSQLDFPRRSAWPAISSAIIRRHDRKRRITR